MLLLLLMLCLMCLLGLCLAKYVTTPQKAHESADFYRAHCESIKARADDGELVFNFDWTAFTKLYQCNPQLKYISGLDGYLLAYGDQEVFKQWYLLNARQYEQFDVAAFDALIEAFKQLTALLDKDGVKAAGNPMIVYTSTDDTGFTFIAEIPVDQDVKNLGKNMSKGNSPDGKALKFVHRGSYDNMDNTYEAITNHLDDKKLEAKDTFIEEYITDPLKTAEDKLVINVYVPLK